MVFLPVVSNHLIDDILEFLFLCREFACSVTALMPLLCEEIDLCVFPGFVHQRGKTIIKRAESGGHDVGKRMEDGQMIIHS